MLALRYGGVVAIAIWVGGAIALGAIAAPSIFDIAGARHVADGRVLAGAIVGEILRRFLFLACGCAAVLLASLVVRAALGPKPARFGLRVAILTLMLASTLFAGSVLTGRMERVRVAAGGALSALPEGDPRRAEFGRLHGVFTVLQLVPILGGLALMFWEVRDGA